MTNHSNAVVGFRAHTGWAAAVVVTGGDWPTVIDRRRIAYEPSAGRFLYHQASEMGAVKGENLVTMGRRQALRAARRAIKDLIADLASRYFKVAVAAIPAGNTKLPNSLTEILAAHSRIHAAEGAFYRETLADACQALGLSVYRPPERDLSSVVSARTKLDTTQIAFRIREMGKEFGPPWSEDQKVAALAAWSCGEMATEAARTAPRRKPQRSLDVQ